MIQAANERNPVPPQPRCDWRDVAFALALAIGTVALGAALQLGRIYGNDGAMLADWTALPERAYHQYHNTLYLPAASLVERVVPPTLLAAADDPLWVAKSLSSLAAGIGILFTFLCCRWIGIPRAASAAGTGLLAVSPVAWFFGATIEVHSLHFAVVAAAAWVTVVAPWRRPGVALAITAVVFVVPYLSHQSAPVLGPGWILWVQCARRRVAAAFSLRALFGIGVVLLLALLVGHMLVQWRRGLGFGADFGGVATTVGQWRRPFTWAIVGTAVVMPLGLMLPLVAVASCRRAIDGWLRATVLVVQVPLAACVVWWGIAEQGGYLLGPAVLLAVAVAAWLATLPHGMSVAIAVAAIAGQAWLGQKCIRDFDGEGFQLEERAARVRTGLGEHGLLVSCNDNAPNVAIWFRGVNEINLLGSLAHEVPLDTWWSTVQPVLAGFGTVDRFLVDVSFRLRPDLPDRVRDGMLRLESALRADWKVTELPHPSWPMWLVAKK